MKPSYVLFLLGHVGLLLISSADSKCLAADQHSILQVSTEFSGGSGDVEKIDQETRVIRLHPTHYRDQGWACWWFIKVSGVKPGETMTLDVGGGVWATPDQCVFSTDGQSWKQTSLGTRSEKGRIVYQQKIDSDQAWFAWGPPFVSTDAKNLVTEAASKCRWATPFLLATTREGHDTPAIRIREPGVDDANRKGIWIQARQHAWEAGSSWVCKGVLDWLISDDPEAAALRQCSDIVVVPIMDIDHVEQGAGGKGAIPQDHNRDWSDHPHWRSVEAAQKMILEMNSTAQFEIFIDLHNPDAQSKKPFFFTAPEEILTEQGKQNLARFLGIARKEMKAPLAFIGEVRESGSKYDQKWEVISKNWVARKCQPGVVAITLETAWNTPDSNVGGYQHVGKGLAKTISQYVLTKTDPQTKRAEPVSGNP